MNGVLLEAVILESQEGQHHLASVHSSFITREVELEIVGVVRMETRRRAISQRYHGTHSRLTNC